MKTFLGIDVGSLSTKMALLGASRELISHIYIPTQGQPVRALQPDIGLLTTHPTEGEFPFIAGSVKMAQRIGLRTAAPAHYSCFTRRNFDPQAWAAQFPDNGPRPIVIPYNSSITYATTDQP